jgi:hypothetical protein
VYGRDSNESCTKDLVIDTIMVMVMAMAMGYRGIHGGLQPGYLARREMAQWYSRWSLFLIQGLSRHMHIALTLQESNLIAPPNT